MAYLLMFFLLVIGIIDYRHKLTRILVTSILLLFMLVIIGLNIASPDYTSFEFMYYNLQYYEQHEPGFVFMCHLFNSLGWTFQSFRMVVALIVTMFFSLSVFRLTKNYNVALALFLLYPFLGYASGLRQAIGSSIVCFSFTFLLRNLKWDSVKFVSGVLVASLFHYSSLIYLFFLILNLKGLKRRTIIMLSVTQLILFELLKRNYLYIIVSKYISNRKITNWFNYSSISHPSIWSVMVIVCVQIVILYFIKISVLQLIEYNEKYGSAIQRKGINIEPLRVLKFNYLLLWFIPGYLLNFNFLRLFQGVLLLNYAIISEVVYLRKRNSLSSHGLPRGYVLPIIVLLAAVLSILTLGSISVIVLENNSLL